MITRKQLCQCKIGCTSSRKVWDKWLTTFWEHNKSNNRYINNSLDMKPGERAQPRSLPLSAPLWHVFTFFSLRYRFLIQGQISNLITARPMASTVLTTSSAFNFLCRLFRRKFRENLRGGFWCSWVVTLRRSDCQEARCSLIRWLSINLQVNVSWGRLL